MKNKITSVSITVLAYSTTLPSKRLGYIAFHRMNAETDKGYVSTNAGINPRNYQRALLAQRLFTERLLTIEKERFAND